MTSHPGQLNLAIPAWVGAVSTSESWDVPDTLFDVLAPYPWSCSIDWLRAKEMEISAAPWVLCVGKNFYVT